MTPFFFTLKFETDIIGSMLSNTKALITNTQRKLKYSRKNQPAQPVNCYISLLVSRLI